MGSIVVAVAVDILPRSRTEGVSVIEALWFWFRGVANWSSSSEFSSDCTGSLYLGFSSPESSLSYCMYN